MRPQEQAGAERLEADRQRGERDVTGAAEETKTLKRTVKYQTPPRDRG